MPLLPDSLNPLLRPTLEQVFTEATNNIINDVRCKDHKKEVLDAFTTPWVQPFLYGPGGCGLSTLLSSSLKELKIDEVAFHCSREDDLRSISGVIREGIDMYGIGQKFFRNRMEKETTIEQLAELLVRKNRTSFVVDHFELLHPQLQKDMLLLQELVSGSRRSKMVIVAARPADVPAPKSEGHVRLIEVGAFTAEEKKAIVSGGEKLLNMQISGDALPEIWSETENEDASPRRIHMICYNLCKQERIYRRQRKPKVIGTNAQIKLIIKDLQQAEKGGAGKNLS